MGDADVKALVRGCTQLTRLHLGSMSDIRGEGYVALGGLSKLSKVNLYGVVQMQVEHVQQLLRMLPELKVMFADVEVVFHPLVAVDWKAVAKECGCPHVHVCIM